MDSRAHYHVKHSLIYHLVLVTKYRRQCLSPDCWVSIRKTFKHLSEQCGFEVIELEGDTDHIHLLFRTNPSIKLSVIVNTIKTITSRQVRSENRTHLTTYLRKGLWARAYFITTVGSTDSNTVKTYLTNGHHRS